MKRTGIVILCLSMLYATAGFAQPSLYARKVVETLASPQLKGRGYVQKGDQLASAYIAGEFKAAGLHPLNKASYFQNFDLPVNTFPGKVEVAVNGQLLKTGADYLVSAFSPSIKGTFQVVHAKSGELLNPTQVLTRVHQAPGALLVIDDLSEVATDAAAAKVIKENLQALQQNADIALKGLVILTNKKLTWTTLTFQGPRPVITINKAGLHAGDIKELKLNIEAKLVPSYITRNVGAMMKGTGGTDSTVVVTAHYDHLGMLGDKVYFPGANDNASGVAMMLSMAKHYAAHPPRYNVVFLAFSGEEIGILGSKAFVENPLIDLTKIKFLVNFDLAGTGEEGIKVVNGSIYRKQFDQLVQLNDNKKRVAKVDIRGEACNSDHCRFYEKGVPSFFIYTQGGIAAYHDIYDQAGTLPLTAFDPYFELMVEFFDHSLL